MSDLLGCISFDSYIKPQLSYQMTQQHLRCISFDSYIKPQLQEALIYHFAVVYLLIPTSNHNYTAVNCKKRMLYIFWFLHQTTTVIHSPLNASTLYIFWFLHQTTTPEISFFSPSRCISFDSYIKPQLFKRYAVYASVVYLLIPTSNHNRLKGVNGDGHVVYLLIPTSNHNLSASWCLSLQVVYLLIPTSNHNKHSIANRWW